MNKKLSIALLISLVSFSGVASMAGTISWFVQNAKLNPNVTPINGETDSSYFAYGNGKASSSTDSPYGISKPRHLYNLAWLTYLGYYNEQKYFELADNLDMTGWTLPPIGTPENPFIGNFNGNGYVISNITISNNYTDYGTKHPSIVTKNVFESGDNPFTTNITETDNYPNIVGFFGVVGNYHSKYTELTYTPGINEIKTFGICGINVKTVAGQTLIGALAGYVDGTISNVAVDSSTLNIASEDDNHNPITHTALPSSDVPSGNLSDFSIIGYSKNTKQIRKVNESIYDIEVAHEEEFNVPDGGDGVGWGGSINMYDLYLRLDKMRSNLKSNNSGYTNQTSSEYEFRIKTNRAANGTETTTNTYKSSAGDLLTYYNTSNREYGNYVMHKTANGANAEDDYVYLMGGKNKVTTYEEYYYGSVITDGKGNYMKVNSKRANQNVINTSSSGNPTGWVLPSKSTANIYTTNNNNKFYLVTGNSVTLGSGDNQVTHIKLKLSSANATILPETDESYNPATNPIWFTRTDGTTDNNLSGMVKFTTTINGKLHYLNILDTDEDDENVDLNWVLSPMPSEPSPLGPEPLWPAGYPDGPVYLNANNYMQNGWQIYYTDASDGARHYIDITFSATPDADHDKSYINSLSEPTDGFIIDENSLTGTSGSKQTTISNGGKYIEALFKQSTQVCNNPTVDEDTLSFSDEASDYRKWTVYKKDNKYAFLLNIHYGKEANTCGTITKYANWYLSLNYNNGVFQLYEVDDIEDGSGRSFNSESIPDSSFFTVDTTANVIDDLNHNPEYGIEQQYDAAVDKHAAWVTRVGQYDSEYETYFNGDKNSYIVNMNGVSQTQAGVFTDEYNPAKDTMIYDGDNTAYIPLNIKKDGAFTSESDLAPTDSNTGYIVAGSTITNGSQSFGAGQSNIRVAKYKMQDMISNSFEMNNEKLQSVWTVDDGGNRTINNNTQTNIETSSYQKYPKSFADFEQKLKDSKTASNSVYGMRFFNGTISMDHLVTVPAVKIYNDKNLTYTNYQLPVDSIDFNLTDRGYINFFAGTYINNNSEIDSFFSLHQIIRDNNNQIIAIKEIQAIYSDGEDTHSYILQYKDAPIKFSIPYVIEDGVRYNLAADPNTQQDYSESNKHKPNSTMLVSDYNEYRAKRNYEMIFNTDWITNHDSDGNKIKSLTQFMLYYFEIPVNEGEYCLGSVPGASGAYLNYLDIGANASRTQRTTVYENFTGDDNVYKYPVGAAYIDLPGDYRPGTGKYINQIDSTTEQLADETVIVDEMDSVCISITVGYTGDFTVERTGDNVTLIRAVTADNVPPTSVPIYRGDTINSFKDDGSTKQLEITPVSHSTYWIKRLSYYDYSAFLDDWTLTVIEDTSTNGGVSWSRSVVQYVHYHYGETNTDNKITDYSKMNIYETTTGTKYQYVNGNYEFLDQTKLLNPTADLENLAILITIQVRQDATNPNNGFAQDVVATYTQDIDSETGTTCYFFDEYQVKITPVGSNLYIVVIYVAQGSAYKDVYIYNGTNFVKITSTQTDIITISP